MAIDTLTMMGHDKIYTGLAGIDTARLKSIRNASLRACFNRPFESRHKMEFVARILGREYIDDAASRTINATWYTLERMQGGIVWIACGSEVDADYSRLVPTALRKVRMLLVLGPDARLKRTFSGIIPTIHSCASMAEALHAAYLYEAVDVKVVFSPACDDGIPAGEWGERFCREVNEL